MITKPDNDLREYKPLVLANQLQVLLISDPTTDKAACALDVQVGSHSDPGVDGLAHFVEHLLFMGTEKYPVENEYSSFLSNHGGHSNAFTSGENTNYYFDVASEHIEGALDRFAQFFICPLFLETCTDRELLAVDSEHKKNLQSDAWRNHQLDKDLSNPDHAYCNFGTGNLETLRDIPIANGVDIRKVLLDFHAKFYSANIMKLVILAKEPMLQLEKWATDLFTPIINKNIAIPSFPGHPLTPTELQTQIFVKPVKETKSLVITFPLPDMHAHYKTHPSQYAAHLIGHEGEGSILSLLKTRGWAQSLSAGASGGYTGYDFFRISVELTTLGVTHYEDVIVSIFDYIKMIQSHGPLEHVFRECQAIHAIHFRFKENNSPSSYCSSLAGHLHEFPAVDVLSGSYLMDVYDAQLIEEILDLLTRDNFRIMLQSPHFDVSSWDLAKWYGTPYKVSPLSNSLKQRLSFLSMNADLVLPEPNNFIAENLSVERVIVETPALNAMIITENDKMRLWHKKDDTFFVPKVNVLFEMKSPLAYQDVLCCVLTRLYVELLKDALIEFSYYAELAGLEYSLENTTDGMTLSLNGFNEKMYLLLEKIIEKMKSAHFNEHQFKRMKERAAKQYKNWFMDSPHSHAMYFMTLMTQEKLYTTQEKIDVLSDVSLEDVLDFAPVLLSRLHIEGLVHGNMTESEAKRLGDIVIAGLSYESLDEPDRYPDMASPLVYTHFVTNSDNINSAMEYCIQVGPESDVSVRILLGLLCQAASEPVFDQLRTKEQLGYMVFSGMRKQHMLGFRIVVQSEKPPSFVEARIEAFIEKLGGIIESLNPEVYKKHQVALCNKLTENLKNLNQETSRLWNAITSGRYDFEQHFNDALAIPHVTKQDLLAFYKKHIVSPARRIISVHIMSQKLAAEDKSVGIEINTETVALFKATAEIQRNSKGEPITKFIKASL